MHLLVTRNTRCIRHYAHPHERQFACPEPFRNAMDPGQVHDIRVARERKSVDDIRSRYISEKPDLAPVFCCMSADKASRCFDNYR